MLERPPFASCASQPIRHIDWYNSSEIFPTFDTVRGSHCFAGNAVPPLEAVPESRESTPTNWCRRRPRFSPLRGCFWIQCGAPGNSNSCSPGGRIMLYAVIASSSASSGAHPLNVLLSPAVPAVPSSRHRKSAVLAF